jgi:heptaprenyl diphosphate synthase/octaprenyl-diphosphate synthase
MKATDFSELLGIEGLDASLDEVADALDVSLVGTIELVEPARRMLHAGGKRLRPLLTVAAAVASDPAVVVEPLDGRVRSGAASVELVHVGSLVHDDIMDEALYRRGVPTVNSVEGASQALLVGDFLLARAGVEAAKVSKEVALSLAVTISDLCDGQSLEGLHQRRIDRSVDAAIESIRGKTGALMRAACDIGALCVERQDLAGAFGAFGMSFGIAFQLADDLLDLLSTEELMGKPVNNDVRAGVFTVPMLLTLDQADPVRRAHLGELMLAAAHDADASAEFRDAVLAGDAVGRTLAMIESHNADARAALATVPDSVTRQGLSDMPQRYLDGILAEKVPTALR